MAATDKKKKKIGFKNLKPESDKKPDDASSFTHSHQKTAHALENAKMVQKGKKYWEEKEQYDHMTDVEWWQLKAAKDFETGIGQTFYHKGTLSTWTGEQIAALQKEMQQTLQLAGYHDDQPDEVGLNAPTTVTVTPKKADHDLGTMSDFAAEIKRQKQKQKTENKKHKKHEEEEEHDPLYHFDDEIIHTGDSDEEDDDGKQSKYQGQSMSISFDASQLQELTSMDQLAGSFDAARMGAHRRTRTEALRVKLQGMQQQLEQVSALSSTQGDQLEEQKQRESVRGLELHSKLNGLTGALQSANNELDRAEEQITDKDEQIANLKRELLISKQMSTELAQTALDVNSGLTSDDLLKQRVRDANRFAFMLSAMQEQLDFERKQFVHKIHNLELQLEHKDVQLNALYELYNKLVAQTKGNKSWWEKLSSYGGSITSSSK